MNKNNPIPPEFKELEDQLRAALKPENVERLDESRRETLLNKAAELHRTRKWNRRFLQIAAAVIIGCVLSATMLLPALNQPQEKARQISAMSDMKLRLQEMQQKLDASTGLAAIAEPSLAIAEETSDSDILRPEPASPPVRSLPKAAYFPDERRNALSRSKLTEENIVAKKEIKHRPMMTELPAIAYAQQNRLPRPLSMKSPEAEPLSTFGIDTDNRSYIAARSALRNGQRPSPGDIRAEEFVNYFGNDTPEPQDGAAFNQSAQLARNPFRPENRFLAIGIRGKSESRRQQTGQPYTILVDASGSMALPERWDNAQKSVALLKKKLSKSQSVTVEYCNDSAEQPGGNSNLTEQLRERLNIQQVGNAGNFIVITDGDDAPQEMPLRDELLNQAAALRTNNGSLHVLAAGDMSSPEFWEKLAEKGGGSLIGIDDPQTAQQFFDEELDARLRPIAEDVKIQLEFNPAAVRNYRLVGYAERAMRPEDFRNDSYRTSPVGSGQAVTAIYELTLQPKVKPETLLATLRTRYRNIDMPGVEELSMPITAAGADRDFTTMPAAFRNAAVAGEFAEYLKYPGLSGIATPSGMLEVLPKFQTGRPAELNELLQQIQ